MTQIKLGIEDDKPKYTPEQAIKALHPLIFSDIRNPLAIAQGYVSVIELDLDSNVIPDHEQLSEYITNINKSLNRASAIISTMMDIIHNTEIGED